MWIIEFSAAILTLLCVWLLSEKNTYGWPIGIIAAVLFFIVFLKADLLFQTLLQVVYVIQSVYGWWIWNKETDNDDLKLAEIDTTTFITDILLALGLTLSTLPYFEVVTLTTFLDVLTTLLALLATYYLSNKIVQSWYLWVIVNLLLICLCVVNSLWWTLGLEIILLTIAFNTSLEWSLILTRQKYANGEKV